MRNYKRLSMLVLVAVLAVLTGLSISLGGNRGDASHVFAATTSPTVVASPIPVATVCKGCSQPNPNGGAVTSPVQVAPGSVQTGGGGTSPQLPTTGGGDGSPTSPYVPLVLLACTLIAVGRLTYRSKH